MSRDQSHSPLPSDEGAELGAIISPDIKLSARHLRFSEAAAAAAAEEDAAASAAAELDAAPTAAGLPSATEELDDELIAIGAGAEASAGGLGTTGGSLASSTLGSSAPLPALQQGQQPRAAPVEVYVRVRPLVERERGEAVTLRVSEDARTVIATAPQHAKAEQKEYTFTRAFGEHCSNEDIYSQAVEQGLEDAITRGMSYLLFSYGASLPRSSSSFLSFCFCDGVRTGCG